MIKDQLSLLLPSYDDLVSKNHLVRIINIIIDSQDISVLEKGYKGGGTLSYYSPMLLQALNKNIIYQK